MEPLNKLYFKKEIFELVPDSPGAANSLPVIAIFQETS